MLPWTGISTGMEATEGQRIVVDLDDGACTEAMPVWLANEAPKATIRSLSFMNQLAMGVPLAARGRRTRARWESAMRPLPLKVVATGAPNVLGQGPITASISNRAPAPTMIKWTLGLGRMPIGGARPGLRSAGAMVA